MFGVSKSILKSIKNDLFLEWNILVIGFMLKEIRYRWIIWEISDQHT